MKFSLNTVAVILFSLLVIPAFGQTEKEWKKHYKAIEKSKSNKSLKWSMDTLFAAGIPYCIMKRNKGLVPAYEAYSLEGHGPVIIEETSTYESPKKTGGYYEYNFKWNNWDRIVLQYVSILNIGQQIQARVFESKLFGADGRTFDPTLLEAKSILDMDLKTAFSFTGTRKKNQDLSQNLEIDRTRQEIRRGDKRIGTYQQKKYDDVSYLAFFYDEVNPFLVLEWTGEAKTIEFETEKDRKTHLLTLKGNEEDLEIVINYLVKNEYL